MAVGRCLVIFEVNGMIVRPMRGHELGFLSGEYIKEIVVFRGNNFSNKLPLICWKWLGVEGGSQGRIISDSSKLSCALEWVYWHVAEGKDLIALVYQLFEGHGSDKTDRG